MGDSLSTAVRKLRAVSADLNQTTDEAQQLVKEVEDLLNEELSIGAHAFITVDGPTGSIASSTWLEYRRVGSRFRIAVVKGSELDCEDEEVRPWSDCPRQEKLRTILKLPELILEIAKNSEKLLNSSKAALNSVREVVRTLRGEEA